VATSGSTGGHCWIGGRTRHKAHKAPGECRDVDPHGRVDEPAVIEAVRTGEPIRLPAGYDVPGAVHGITVFAGVAPTLEGRAGGGHSADHTSSARREAFGVVGSIAALDHAPRTAARKIPPAVTVGNAIVREPGELTPRTALTLAETARVAGIPDGVEPAPHRSRRVLGLPPLAEPAPRPDRAHRARTPP
jgi:hypothetical protein